MLHNSENLNKLIVVGNILKHNFFLRKSHEKNEKELKYPFIREATIFSIVF